MRLSCGSMEQQRIEQGEFEAKISDEKRASLGVARVTGQCHPLGSCCQQRPERTKISPRGQGRFKLEGVWDRIMPPIPPEQAADLQGLCSRGVLAAGDHRCLVLE